MAPNISIGSIRARKNANTVGALIYRPVYVDRLYPPDDREATAVGPEDSRDFYAAMFKTNPKVDKSRFLRENIRAKGTCEWIKRHDAYKLWRESDSSQLLWLKGPPGIGKTVMSLYLADELENELVNSKVSFLMYYFCYDDNRRNNVVAVLSGLVFQLVRRQQDLIEHMMGDFDLCKQNQGLFSEANKDLLWKNFREILAYLEAKTVYCVLDGLDECVDDSLEWIVGKLQELTTDSYFDKRLKCLFTCSNTRDKDSIIPLSVSSLNLDTLRNEEVQADLQRFISEKSSWLAKACGYEESEKLEVENTLKQDAEGTFLWVGRVVEELRKTPRSEIKDTLKQIPHELTSIYQRMLRSLEKRQASVTKIAETLRYLVVTVRPVTLTELHILIGAKDKLATRDQVDSAGGFLKIVGTEVHFVHQSAKKFILELDEKPSLQVFHVDKAKTHHDIAQKCIQYIQNAALDNGPISLAKENGSLQRAVRQQHPLLEYAIRYWPEHTRATSRKNTDKIISAKFFSSSACTIRENWFKTYWSLSNHTWGPPEGFEIIHIAAFFGFVPLLSRFLTERRLEGPKALRSALHRETSHSMTALHWASRNGHVDIVERLLKDGANLAGKGYGMTPLTWAVRNGHYDVVQLLLQHQADAEVKDYGLTALNWAAWEGKEKVVEELLRWNADVDAMSSSVKPQFQTWLDKPVSKCEFPWSSASEAALLSSAAELAQQQEQAKAEAFHDWVVAFSLGCGIPLRWPMAAVFNTILISWEQDRQWLAARQGIIGNQQVCWAAVTPLGRWRLLKEILANHLNLASVRSTIIQLNCSLVRIVPYLLSLGLYIYACRWYDLCVALFLLLYWICQTVVMESVWFVTRSRVVRFLPYIYFVALWFTPWRGHKPWTWSISILISLIIIYVIGWAGYVIEEYVLLLWAGVACPIGAAILAARIKLIRGYTSLHLAAWRGHEKVVNSLLQYGADVEAADNEGWTALTLALSSGHQATMQVLLAHEAQIGTDAPLTIVELAASVGRVDILRELRKKGVDVNERYKHGCTALHSAACAGQMGAATYLLTEGADPNIISEEEFSVLHFAVAGGNVEVIQMLLDRGGLDVNQASKFDDTPLHVVVVQLREETAGKALKLLLEKGANPNLVNKAGFSPFDIAREREPLFQTMKTLHNDYHPTSESVRSETLYRSIQELARECIKAPKNHRYFGWLGVLLLQFRSLTDAKFALKLSADINGVFEWANCDGCNMAIVDELFVCTTCYDTALCVDCMRKYEKGLRLPVYCRNHEHLQVSGMFWQDRDKHDNQEAYTTQHNWLTRILDNLEHDAMSPWHTRNLNPVPRTTGFL